MADSADNKTEQPTQRRLNKARNEGQVAQSVEFCSVVALVVMLAAISLLAPNLLNWTMNEMRSGFSARTDVFTNTQAFMEFVSTKILSLLGAIAPILGALVLAGITSNVIVAGPNFSPNAVKFKLDAISPSKGFGKLFNTKSLVKLVFSIAKIIIVTAVVYLYLRDKLPALAAIRWAWSTDIIASMAKLILGMMIRVCIALTVVAIADLAYQKWKYIEDLKMTKKEVKDEHKDTEGSPEVKRRIRNIQFQAALKRMTQEVPKANVVLVNPTHYAVAVKYDSKTMEAPVLVAKGADYMAEKIREIARAHGIPILRRPELTRTIYATLQPGQQIPRELYVAVAEILALVYRLKHAKV
jgi:flagellar biosynthetic protein FlhB